MEELARAPFLPIFFAIVSFHTVDSMHFPEELLRRCLFSKTAVI